MGDSDQPPANVAIGGESGVGAHRVEKRRGPRVVGINWSKKCPTDPEHHLAVFGDDTLEGLHTHILSTTTKPRS